MSRLLQDNDNKEFIKFIKAMFWEILTYFPDRYLGTLWYIISEFLHQYIFKRFHHQLLVTIRQYANTNGKFEAVQL